MTNENGATLVKFRFFHISFTLISAFFSIKALDKSTGGAIMGTTPIIVLLYKIVFKITLQQKEKFQFVHFI